jgi:hydroxymethylbilane synthase
MRLGTRGSALALAQSSGVAASIGPYVELVEITTAGDRSAAPVAELGVGVFVSALREALLAKEIDLAVHSYKDLPTAPADGLIIAAVPQRADPRDALIARDNLTLAELGPGATIGTGSVRRIAQLHALGRGLVPVPIRGNVDTRLRKVSSGELDAVVLARAGLVRLGRAVEITETLDPLLMLPAPAQGALAIECRAGDTDVVELLARLDDRYTRAAVEAERALLAELEAGCSAPVAALAEVAEGDEEVEIYLRGAVFSLDGTQSIRLSRTGTMTDPAGVGRALARDLRGEGADGLQGETAAVSERSGAERAVKRPHSGGQRP